MSNIQPVDKRKKRVSIPALAAALLSVWKLPAAYGLAAGSALFASHAMSAVLAAGLYLLLRRAFLCSDKRLLRMCYGLGLLFALFTVIGGHLQLNGRFLPATWLSALDGALTTVLFTLVFGAALIILFQSADSFLARRKPGSGESLFSKLLGNGFLIFPLLLICWLPALLACWPGSISIDGVRQFYEYMDGMHSTHHPLLHTLFLGFCMMTGIDIDPEGSASTGLLVYSAAQMILMAALIAYACYRIRRMRVPLWARVCVTVLFAAFPMYALWSFNAVKDVLFAGFALHFALDLVELWRDDYAPLRSPLRIIRFVITATLMMLLRNNGVYALCLLLPFAAAWAKGARVRVTLLLLGCVASYILSNGALVWATEAESGSIVEMLSIPLQQIGRTMRDNPAAIESEEDMELIATLFGEDQPAEYYAAESADPLKWITDYDTIDENVPKLLMMWARLGVRNIKSYSEAFLVQNLPYYLPGADMKFRLDLGIMPIDLYPMEAESWLPGLQKVYERYDETLMFLDLPFIYPLSDTAFVMWLAMAGFTLGLYLRRKDIMAAFGFVIAVWLTCLLGPLAAMRYMLYCFYAVPVLLTVTLAPDKHLPARSGTAIT